MSRRRRTITCLLAAALAAAGAAPARAASLDPTFGDQGRVVLDMGAQTWVMAGDLALQPDGRIVAVGWAGNHLALVRLLPTGKLDPGFGRGGLVLSGFGMLLRDRTPAALALQPDGKLIAVGAQQGGLYTAFGVMRLNPDGSLDTTFGEGGTVTTPVGTRGANPEDVAVQPDGKIVVAGYHETEGAGSDFAVVRYTPEGRLDPGFGQGGIALLPMSPDTQADTISALALLPDGRLQLAGGMIRAVTGFDWAAARLLPSGAPDPAFGDLGRVPLALGVGGRQDVLTDMQLQADGSVVMSGLAFKEGFGPSEVALARLRPDGTPDAAFGNGGQVLTALGTREDTSAGVVVAGGAIYAAVDSRGFEPGPDPAEPYMTRRLGVLALDAAGRPDESFAPAGALLFHMTEYGDDRVAGIVARPDGSLVLLATVRVPDGDSDTFGFAVVKPRADEPVSPPIDAPVPPAQRIAPSSAITSPRTGPRPRRVRELRGTAAGQIGVERVDVTVLRYVRVRNRTRCRFLSGKSARFGKPRTCENPTWLRASGTSTWRYRLRKALPRGSYVAFSRARGGGLTEALGAKGDANRVAFKSR